MKSLYFILFSLFFWSIQGQNQPSLKPSKPTTTQKSNQTATKNEIEKSVVAKKPTSESKPDAVKEKPKNENSIESLIIENQVDTSKTHVENINISEAVEDTIVVEKILPEEISNLQKGKAYILGKKILTACTTSKIKEFSENDFSERILKKFSLDYLSNICVNVNRRFGDFQDLLFKEALRVEKQKITIYRFKAVYEKKFFVKELRVYMNDQNKITSLKTIPWKPEFKPRKKRRLRRQIIDSLLIRDKDSLFKDSTKIIENKNIIQEKVDKSFLLE